METAKIENINKTIKNKIDLLTEKMLEGEKNSDLFVFDWKEYWLDEIEQGIEPYYTFSNLKDKSDIILKTYDEMFDYYYNEYIDEEQDKGIAQD